MILNINSDYFPKEHLLLTFFIANAIKLHSLSSVFKALSSVFANGQCFCLSHYKRELLANANQ
jgi:hypothetical protein